MFFLEIILGIFILILEELSDELMQRKRFFFGIFLITFSFLLSTGDIGIWHLTKENAELLLDANNTQCNPNLSFVIKEPFFAFWITVYSIAFVVLSILTKDFTSWVRSMLNMLVVCTISPIRLSYPLQVFIMGTLNKLSTFYIGVCHLTGFNRQADMVHVYWILISIVAYLDYNTRFITRNNLFICNPERG